MRWLTRTLLFGTLAAALAVNLPAQRGGGQRGAPLPSSTAIGAGAGHFGPSATARSSAPARASGYRSGFTSYGYRSVGRRSEGATYRSRGVYGRDHRNYPFAYWIAPYYYAPFDYADNSYPEPPEDAGYDPGEQAAIMAQQALVQQVQKLSDQVAQLQSGQQMQASSEPEPPLPPEVPITLVLRDGRQLQVRSYAVMDQTFWDFSKQAVRKIPISNIDVAASTKATEAQGGEFPHLQ
jgi:hypothetical protein